MSCFPSWCCCCCKSGSESSFDVKPMPNEDFVKTQPLNYQLNIPKSPSTAAEPSVSPVSAVDGAQPTTTDGSNVIGRRTRKETITEQPAAAAQQEPSIESPAKPIPLARRVRKDTFTATTTTTSDEPVNVQTQIELQQAETPAQPHRPDRECFFVITVVFNPASFQKRYNLYHQFAAHMKESGAQLITIECIFPTLDQHEFKVTEANNPNHIQLKSKCIYWMKENLINIAVSKLPSHAKWICWLDADIQFHERNWIDQTIQALEMYTVVQMFEKAHFLGPQNEELRTDYSFGYSVVHRKIIDQSRYAEWYPHPGYGWAMEKATFLRMNGLPDYDIVGSGDLHFAFSLLNRVSNAIERDLNSNFKKYMIQHSQGIYDKLLLVSREEVKLIVGYVPLTINHYWHGSRKDRQYVDRWKILIAHDFNYLTDVRKNREGLLELTTRASSSKLQEDIQLHFQMRNEDEMEYDSADNIVVGEEKMKTKKKKLKKKKPKKKKRSFDGGEDDSSSSSSAGYDNYAFDPDSGDVGTSSSDSKPDSGDEGSDDHGGHISDANQHDEDYHESVQIVEIADQDNEHHNSHFEIAEPSYANDYNGTIESTSQY